MSDSMESGGLNYWRMYFKSADSDIFDVIENAIVVAALDCPKELQKKRDKIAEKLFSCNFSRCFGCGNVALQIPEGGDDVGREKDCGNGGIVRDKGSVNDDHVERKTMVSNYSFDEAEALTEEIEEEGQTVREVLRIKEVLDSKQDESDSVLFESLRRLQLMGLSYEILSATHIGKAVSGLRKNSSKQIRDLVKTLINGWKLIADDWIKATASLTQEAAQATPESVNPSELVNEGLPFPPLDEAALIATQTAPLEFNQRFFDGIDDDGNPQQSGVHDKHQDYRKTSTIITAHLNHIRRQPPHSSNFENKDTVGAHDVKKQFKIEELTRLPTQVQPKLDHLSCPKPWSARPPNLSSNRNDTGNVKSHRQPSAAIAQEKPETSVQDKPKLMDDNSVRAKLEIAKRKLQEGYQNADNAKKQRTVQVMELHDLPKQAVNHRQPLMKSRNFNRKWANGRS